MLDLDPLTLSLCSVPFLLFLFFRLSRSAASPRPPGGPAETPCPESHPFIGNLVGFLRNRHRFHDWVADMLSRTPSSTLRVHAFLGLSRGVCTSNPVNLQHLLSSNFPNYVKGSRYHAVLRELLGDGIFAVDGHLWSLQRKIASHEFTTRSLKQFISETVGREISDRLLPFLSRACDEGRVVDLQEALQRFSFDNICSVAFGVDPNCFAAAGEAWGISGRNSAFVKAFDEAVENCSSRFISPLPVLWKLKRFFNIGSEKRFKSNIRVINEFAMEVIRSKEEQLESATGRENSDETSRDRDLLSRFMSSSADLEFRDLEEKRKFLRDIVISFVLAGKDTTSTALTWFFWLIAAHPSCEREILRELSSAAAAEAATTSEVKIFSYDELKSLHYLHAAVTESMRLFPPVPINSRLTVNDDVLPDGTRVGKGWFADYSAYAVGRSEEVWGPDCREFKPERWLDGGDGDGDGQSVRFRPSDQWKYPVFHCGPRMCLGKEMAYVQMKSVAAAVMAEFEVLPAAEDGGESVRRMAEPPYTLSLLLKMRGGLPVRLRRRRRRD